MIFAMILNGGNKSENVNYSNLERIINKLNDA